MQPTWARAWIPTRMVLNTKRYVLTLQQTFNKIMPEANMQGCYFSLWKSSTLISLFPQLTGFQNQCCMESSTVTARDRTPPKPRVDLSGGRAQENTRDAERTAVGLNPGSTTHNMSLAKSLPCCFTFFIHKTD